MRSFYDLRLEIEELADGGDYQFMGTSPDLPNLIVAGDTVEDVIAQAPGVARAIIETMREHGQPLPQGLIQIHEPLQAHILVPA